ncbi:MAG: hypothetical protein WA117_22290, partial [Verrucomicrobiia bacterium]
LDRERLDHQKTRQELQSLIDKYSEEIRILDSIEFRQGKRTGGKWLAFCPKCHIPAVPRRDNHWISCHGGCGWDGVPLRVALEDLIKQIEENHSH